jgi:hypothetical protein
MVRFWMHPRLWLNDPDCMLARETDTALTLAEVQTLATVIGLCGGMVLDSDNLTKLSDERRDMISMLMPVYGKSAPDGSFLVGAPAARWNAGRTGCAVFNRQEAITVSAALPDAPSRLRPVGARYRGTTVPGLIGDSATRMPAVRGAADERAAAGCGQHVTCCRAMEIAPGGREGDA